MRDTARSSADPTQPRALGPTRSARQGWTWSACRFVGRGWALCHQVQLPVLPLVLNYGLAGMLAIAASAAWYLVLHAPLASRMTHVGHFASAS